MARVRNRIQAIREQQGKVAPGEFTQAAVAKRLNISRSSLARWEAGNQIPDALNAVRLARDLSVTVEQLGFEEVREGG